MATTLREKIMLVIEQRLANISKSGGYSQDVRGVRRTISEMPDAPSLPYVFVYEDAEEKDPTYAVGVLRCTFSIVIVYLATANRDERTVANAMLGDITKAIGDEISVTDAVGRNHCVVLDEAYNDVRYTSGSRPIIHVGVEYTVIYSHERGDQTQTSR